MNKKLGIVMSGAVILMAVLVAGCLRSNEHNLNVDNASVHCSASLVPGQI